MIRNFAVTLVSAGLSFAPVVVLAQPLRPPELPAPESAQATVEPGFLGMIADDRQENGRGARIQEVEVSSPAAQGGLRQGDLITAVNGRAVRTLDDMAAVLRPLPPDAKVAFDVERDGTTQRVDVVLGHRPPPDQRRFQQFGRLPNAPSGQTPAGQGATGQTPPASSDPGMRAGGSLPGGSLLGLRTTAVTEQARTRLGLSSTAGAHVVARSLGSPAERANIPLDTVITAVNGQRVGSPSDLTSLITSAGAGSTVEITHIYNGRVVRTNVMLGSSPVGVATGQAPPNETPRTILPPQSDAQRIESLEARVRELEQKLRMLEERLQRGT